MWIHYLYPAAARHDAELNLSLTGTSRFGNGILVTRSMHIQRHFLRLGHRTIGERLSPGTRQCLHMCRSTSSARTWVGLSEVAGFALRC